MPSVGRKFLIAGKSGLNLTNGESWEKFIEKYSGNELPQEQWKNILSQFDNDALRDWALKLGIETFVASSGKVFPKPVDGTIRAAPLLRRWIEKLRALGVEFKTRHRWTGFDSNGQPTFDHSGEAVTAYHDATVLALGGASWPKTGSDGGWQSILIERGIKIVPMAPANCGWEVNWPEQVLHDAEGAPMKNLLLSAGAATRRGELVITRYGLEGGPIYRLGPAIRSQTNPHVIIDFKPDMSEQELNEKMGQVTRNFVREARRRWRLDPATCALLKHLPNRGPWKTSAQLAHEVKHCRIDLTRPRPIGEAISSAGGVAWAELDENLMLQKMPTVFVAGEMIDWEAPTGGYLLQACFATGTHVGHAVSRSSI
ncbi:hypothetical protein NT6N_34870 [Oceaniferula spumae]|uniref:Aminoacetone oxidase family FAD-binding enzyme n=1 Tax=Oceaniferula spumae TaxID=2979115 RepID=A0AAT9FRC7_9BACT